MTCANCKTETQGNYCGHCGHKMFIGHCSNCRKEVFSNFCTHCGTLFKPNGFIVAIKALVQNAALRAQIRQAFDQAIHAQRFLDRMDLSLNSIKDFEVENLEEITAPVRKELGLTGTPAKHQVIDLTMVEVVAEILLVLAQNKYSIETAKGASNGFLITALVPDNLPSWGGNLLFLVEKLEDEIKLTIEAKIKGQAYTLEQSKALIRRMLSEIAAMDVKNVLEDKQN